MSRIGRQPVKLESNVSALLEKGGKYGNVRITIKGPKGELSQDLRQGVDIKVDDELNQVVLNTTEETKQARAFHGLYRSIINNMVYGVVNGYEKKLEIHGVGYRVKLTGDTLDFSLGQNDKVAIKAPTGIQFEVKDEVNIKVSGIDKQMVGEIAAQIRAFKKTEPYKGKGIRYEGEHVRRKQGKTAAK